MKFTIVLAAFFAATAYAAPTPDDVSDDNPSGVILGTPSDSSDNDAVSQAQGTCRQ